MRAFVTPAAAKDSRFVRSVSAADDTKQPPRVKNQREARRLIFISFSSWDDPCVGRQIARRTLRDRFGQPQTDSLPTTYHLPNENHAEEVHPWVHQINSAKMPRTVRLSFAFVLGHPSIKRHNRQFRYTII